MSGTGEIEQMLHQKPPGAATLLVRSSFGGRSQICRAKLAWGLQILLAKPAHNK
jgi:hypothetical protein